MKSSDTMFSIIVPVYNPGKNLFDCVDSILAQTYSVFECILVDDGSSDGSSEVIDEYALKDSRVIAIHKENGGESSARNAGLQIAKGDWVQFVDADDYISPNCLETINNKINALETKVENNRFDVIGFMLSGVYADDRAKETKNEEIGPYGIISNEDAIRIAIDGYGFAVCYVIRKEVASCVRFREDIHWGPDTVYVLEVIHRSQGVYRIPDVLYYYVQTVGSAARASFSERQLTVLKSSEWILDFTRSNYPDLIGYALDRFVNARVNLYYKISITDYRNKEVTDRIYDEVRRSYPKLIKTMKISKKKKIKYSVFYRNPRMYCSLFRFLINHLPGEKYAMYRG